jgi:hypothetical protein
MKTFDWLPHVPPPHIAKLDGSKLIISVPFRKHTFDMPRLTPILSTYRMLGVYQAEGSKSAQAPDFSLAGSNAAFLTHVVELLAAWGLPASRLSLEVLRAKDETPQDARKAFACVPVEVVAERVRTGRGGHAGVLHVLKSSALLHTVQRALAEIFSQGFPSQEAAREYTLGWLDGDGSIIDRGSSIDLMLAGLADEHEVLKRGLMQAFGWVLEAGSYHKNTKQGTQITLRAHEMLDLIDAGAFSFSMNRARLLVAFDRRTDNLRAIRRGKKAVGAFVRWGLCMQGGGLSPLGVRICAGHDRNKVEIERARQILSAAPKGVKGLSYSREV